MAEAANIIPAQVLRLVPNTGAVSPFRALVDDYKRAGDEARRAKRIFNRAFEALPKKAVVTEVIGDEIAALQEAHTRWGEAGRAILEFVEKNY